MKREPSPDGAPADAAPAERRDQPRHDGAPLRWQDVARRKDWATLPFAHYFNDTPDPT